MAKSPEKSFGMKIKPQSVVKAKDELRPFYEAKCAGEDNMTATRVPFCNACMWLEFNRNRQLFEFQQQRGSTPDGIEVPDWHEFSGKEKFKLLTRTERTNRREMTLDIEETYQCLKNDRHHVSICESKALSPDLGLKK